MNRNASGVDQWAATSGEAPTTATTTDSRPAAWIAERKNGKVSIRDGPYAETKEQIGGILLLDANDLNHATELMSKHPGIRGATFEIRPLDEESTANVNTAENP